jgi:hypothetical protein
MLKHQLGDLSARLTWRDWKTRAKPIEIDEKKRMPDSHVNNNGTNCNVNSNRRLACGMKWATWVCTIKNNAPQVFVDAERQPRY